MKNKWQNMHFKGLLGYSTGERVINAFCLINNHFISDVHQVH